MLAKNEYLCSRKSDNMYFSGGFPPIGRVVYRGNNNANANGGVSNANTNNDASNSNANVGSRLENNQKKKESAYNIRDVSLSWSRGG